MDGAPGSSTGLRPWLERIRASGTLKEAIGTPHS